MKVPDICEPWIKKQRTHLNGDVLSQFGKEAQNEYDEIKPFLSGQIHAALDIGCGVGGFDVCLWNDKHPSIWLMDSAQVTAPVYGFDIKPSYYNSFAATEALMEANGVERYNLWASERGIPAIKFDLIVSLLSLGYHYRLETYLKQIKENLDGVLIIDIRETTDGLAILKLNGFDVTEIRRANKAVRVAARRSA